MTLPNGTVLPEKTITSVEFNGSKYLVVEELAEGGGSDITNFYKIKKALESKAIIQQNNLLTSVRYKKNHLLDTHKLIKT